MKEWLDPVTEQEGVIASEKETLAPLLEEQAAKKK